VTKNTPLTQERLREILYYDGETGQFRWRPGSGKRAGRIAGSLAKSEVWLIHFGGRSYKAHQLAWLYITGEWGRPGIDHRDGDTTNNRWSNLRRATSTENAANRRRPRNNTSGFKGVYFDRKRRTWGARIRKGGQSYFLGRFATPHEAHAAYVAAAEDLFGEFARAE
jgi:hypothetical protein